MSSEEYLGDVVTRHQVFVQRYGNGIARRYSSGLAKTNKEVIGRLASKNLDKASQSRLRQIQLDIDQLLKGEYSKRNTQTMLELQKFVGQETGFSATMINNSTIPEFTPALPTETQINTALSLNTFSPDDGKTRVNIEGALNKFSNNRAEAVRQAIRDGIILGDTNELIADRIRDITRVTEAQATTLARTMTNHASSIARDQVVKENADVLDGVVWLATLDTRTTLLCAGRDQTVYPIDSDYPRPPAHFNCRSTLNIKVNEEYDLAGKAVGKRPVVGPKGSADIKGSTTFGSWLKKQPAGFQDEYFSKFKDGKVKAQLFRKGKLPLDRFVDSTGAEYSLDRLRQLNPVEFAKVSD